MLETSCNDNGTFDMQVIYGYQNANNNFVDIILNGDFFGFFELDSLLTLENIPFSLTTDIKTITICINDNPDCCHTVDYIQPDCVPNEECSIDVRLIEYECLENGEYLARINFIAENTSGLYNLYIDGDLYETFQSSSAFIDIGPFENGSFHGYFLEDANNKGCGVDGDIFTQDCVGDPDLCVLDVASIDYVCEGGMPEQIYFELVVSPNMNLYNVYVNDELVLEERLLDCLLYTSPSPRDS